MKRLLCLLLLCACGGNNASLKKETQAFEARNLYPFGAEYVWSHEVGTGAGPPTLAITKVVSISGNLVEVSTGGASMFYELRDEGIWSRARGGWLLKDPMMVGQRWKSAEGTEATIVRAGFSMETKAGSFAPCVLIDERSVEPPKRTETTFCMHVGPVRLESTMELPTQGEASVKANLLGFATSSEL